MNPIWMVIHLSTPGEQTTHAAMSKLPSSQLTFLIASSIFSYAGLRYGQRIEANWSHKIFANRRLPASEQLFGNLHLTI
jgi:hypothetical protein